MAKLCTGTSSPAYYAQHICNKVIKRKSALAISSYPPGGGRVSIPVFSGIRRVHFA